MKNELVGKWKTLQSDYISKLEYGDAEIEFKSNGNLIYTIKDRNKIQKILMRYEIQANKLITTQGSSNNQIKTETIFQLINDLLILEYDGFKSTYLKQPLKWYEKIF